MDELPAPVFLNVLLVGRYENLGLLDDVMTDTQIYGVVARNLEKS